MSILKSKFSLLLVVQYILLVLLIERFNKRFLFFEYGYEPLFVMNTLILITGLLFIIMYNKKLTITFYDVLVYFLCLWMFLSLIFNVNDHSLNGVNLGRIINVIVPMLFVTLIYSWKNRLSKKNIINIIGLMVMIAALIGLTALISILFPEFMISLFNWDLEDISRGTISPINNGTFLALFIIPSIALFIYHDKSKIKYIYIVCFAFILLGLIATGRRGSYFPALIFIFIFFSCLIYKNFTKKGIKKYIKYILIIALFFIVFTLKMIDSGEIGRLFGQVDTEKDNIGRLVRMEPAFESILSKPIIGEGIGNYYLRLNERHLSEVKSVTYNSWIQLSDPHNTYIMILSEVGLIGLLLFMLIIFYVLIKLKPKDIISLAIILSVSVFLINCMVDTRMWKGLVRIDTVFWVFVGLGIVYNEKISKIKNKKTKFNTIT